MTRYANVNGIKTEPASGLKGVCPGCGNPVIAKCGSVKVHHWAHRKRFDCDPWWEPMTQWHLDWQNKFPEAWREVIFRDEQSGEFHRADVHTPKGITLEFQHSAMSAEEMQSRNAFYPKLLWIVNGLRFKGDFDFNNAIPDPESELLKDYNFSVDQDGLAKFAHFIKKEDIKGDGNMVRIYSLHDAEFKAVADLHKNAQHQYWLFNWKYKHRGWLTCSAPVFLDFGDEFLYWIKKRQQVITTLIYLQIVKKKDFLAKYGA
ncbi:competence protein [Mucilaginibacter mali]|uniref:Competence protein n=1 Tax=Mucilaginibacter mali TaxID=2740462 RepID=A0A7D4UP96_9SPHI|nr:competence protein CoiA family protein [Mucilaginibacter mali]QKJ32861.1 competence protein [Mucilaginibacter mali]